MKATKFFLCASVLSMAATFAPAMAQSPANADDGAAAPRTATMPAEEYVGQIIVTAQKRAESVNRVGMAIAAFSGDALKQQGISSVEDLTRLVPDLSVAKTEANTQVYTLRGVGFYDNTLGAYPAVSVYVDEVPLPLPAMAAQAGLDLERVEVLKGPQGTLFGQNATGGAINYIAAKPTREFAAGGEFTYGRFNTVEAGGYVSGPLSDTLRARLAVKTIHGDAWQKSYTRDAKNGRTQSIAGRLLLDWDASERLKFSLSLNASDDKSDPQATQYIELFPQILPATPELAAYPFSPKNPRAADWTPYPSPRAHDKQRQASLKAAFEVTDNVTLTSISNYINFKRDQISDTDGMSLVQFSYNTLGKAETFTQELRLDNGGSGPLRWVVGGNYERTTFSEDGLLRYDAATTAAYVTSWTSQGFRTDQKMRSIAGFGNVEFDVAPQVTVKAGARYTSFRARTTSCAMDDGSGNSSIFFTDVANGLRAAQGLGPIDPILPGGCRNLDNVTTDDQGRILYTAGEFKGLLKEHNVSWRVGVDYKPASNLLFYANVAKGYKAGGFPNTVATAFNKQYLPVTQESLLDYEAGFKAQLMGGNLSVNGALFYYKYNDKQLRVKILDPLFGLLDAIRNVPKSDQKGAELNIVGRPMQGWTIGVSGNYLDAKIKEFDGYNNAAVIQSYSGYPLPFAPKYSLAAFTDYKFPVSGSVDAFVGGNITYRSHTYSTVGTDSYARLPSYTLVDLRAGIASSDNRWRVSVWGRNVFNEYYRTNAIIVNDVKTAFAGRPATYGITLGFGI
ncbi:MAG: TonB-dependent receptor [Sphingobium sp.]